MALTEQELHQEELAQLRLLAQSPGWALLGARLNESVRRNEAEKASLLREGIQGKEARVSYLQGVVDGLDQGQKLLTRAIEELSHEALQEPLY